MKTDPVNRFVVAQITRHRLQKRITVADLAQGSGIPLGSLSCLLTGRYKCSLLNLHRLLAHMGLSILEVWPETSDITPVVNFRTIQVAIREAEARLEPLLSMEEILSAVSRVYGVSPAKLASPVQGTPPERGTGHRCAPCERAASFDCGQIVRSP